MAVKKAVKKTAPRKKAVAKKAVAKKAAPRKKAVAKKAVAKKAAPRKKAVAKKAVPRKKAAVKRTTVKKAAPRKKDIYAEVSDLDRLIERNVSEMPSFLVNSNRTSNNKKSNVFADDSYASQKVQTAPYVEEKRKKRVFVWFFLAFFLFGGVGASMVIGVQKYIAVNDTSMRDTVVPTPTPSATPTPTPSATPTPTPTPPPTRQPKVMKPSPSEAPREFDSSPSENGFIFSWETPEVSSRLIGYQIFSREISEREWALIASLPIQQKSFEVILSSNEGNSEFKVTSLLSTGADSPNKRIIKKKGLA